MKESERDDIEELGEPDIDPEKFKRMLEREKRRLRTSSTNRELTESGKVPVSKTEV